MTVRHDPVVWRQETWVPPGGDRSVERLNAVPPFEVPPSGSQPRRQLQQRRLDMPLRKHLGRRALLATRLRHVRAKHASQGLRP
jgi:hypothetical protein